MKEIKALLADDEEQLRKYLKAKLAEVWPDLVICGEARNGRDALDFIAKHHPEIAFLDIRMPGLTGMEVARKIAGACRVVFITAYDEYAMEAFEKGAVDYLLKPVSRERLEKTVKRLQEQIAAQSKPPSEISEKIERLLADLADRKGVRPICDGSGSSTKMASVSSRLKRCIFFRPKINIQRWSLKGTKNSSGSPSRKSPASWIPINSGKSIGGQS